MAIWYVDSNAVGLNDGTSWTDAFADLTTANLAALAVNDFIYCASDHSYLFSGGLTIDFSFPAGVTIISVNKTTGVYEIGATETIYAAATNSYFNFIHTGGNPVVYIGITLDCYTSFLCNTHNAHAIFIDSILKMSGNTSHSFLGGNYDASCFEFINSEVYANTNSPSVQVSRGAHKKFSNSKFTGAAPTFTSVLSGSVYCYGVDLYSAGSIASPMVATGGAGTDEIFKGVFDRCLFPSGVLANGFIEPVNSVRVSLAVTASTTPDSDHSTYHYFNHTGFSGTIEENTTSYLASTYDGTNGFSADLASSANAGISTPLRHKLCTIPVQDLTTDTTFKVNFTSATALDDAQFWIDAEYNDATNHSLGVIKSGRAVDILSGAAHTTNAEAWTGGLTNTYEQSVTIAGVAGATNNGTVSIYINLAEPSIDVIACPAPVIS